MECYPGTYTPKADAQYNYIPNFEMVCYLDAIFDDSYYTVLHIKTSFTEWIWKKKYFLWSVDKDFRGKQFFTIKGMYNDVEI